MSLFETSDADEVIVSEAFAFIDSFEGNEDINSTSSPSFQTKIAAKDKPIRKKKPNPPGYTTRVQQRKRAELQSLRDEARILEIQLRQLKTENPNTVNTQCSALTDENTFKYESKWKAMVELERNSRRQSEETNHRLREILAQQMKVNKSLRSMLQKGSLLKGIDYVFGNQPTLRHSFAAFENSKAIIGHLEELVAKMYLSSGPIFESWSLSSVGYSMQVRIDKRHGKIAEMKATTPVACSMETAAEIVWQDQNGQRPDPQKWTQRTRGRKPNSQEKIWILSLQCQSYIKHVNGIQFLQRFEEPNRIVFVRTDLMTLTTEGLQFRNKCITIITRSETDPQRSSVVRIFEEMFMDLQDGFQARPEDIEYAQNIILKSLSWKIHNCSHQLQNALIDQFQLPEERE